MGGEESHTLRLLLLLLKRSAAAAAAVHSVARIHAVGLAREAVQLSATAWMRRILVLVLLLLLLVMLLLVLLLAVLLVAGVEVVVMVPALGLTVALVVCHGAETGEGEMFFCEWRCLLLSAISTIRRRVRECVCGCLSLSVCLFCLGGVNGVAKEKQSPSRRRWRRVSGFCSSFPRPDAFCNRS